MLEHFAMTYTIGEFRDWMKEESSSSSSTPTKDLEPLPWSGNYLWSLMEDVKDRFVAKYPSDGEERVELIRSICQSWQEQHIDLVEFSDEHQETELVYAIWIEPAPLQRVVLGFRGSVTQTDWKTDATAVHFSVDITDRGLPIKIEKAKFHKGFYNYMFSTPPEDLPSLEEQGTSGEDKDGKANSRVDEEVGHGGGGGGSRTSKYEVIMAKLNQILASRPDYDLYVTGHSLGGALCTVFSAFCATEKLRGNLPDQINCFSFAGPKIGTLRVQRLLHEAEMSRKLRYLRVVNYKDPVPNAPKDIFLLCQTDMACNLFMNIFCQRNMFRHGGVELKNFPNSKFQISHLPSGPCAFHFLPLFISDVLKTITRMLFCLFACFKCLLCHGENYRRYHAWLVYFHWLDQNKEALDDLYLDDRYDNIRNNHFQGVLRRRY